MLRFKRLGALVVVAMMSAAPLSAETTPAPPDWQDGHGPSVYMAANQQPPVKDTANNNRYSASEERDTAVFPALHTTPAATNEPAGRRLAPPSNRIALPSDKSSQAATGARKMLDFGLPVQSMYSVVTALAIVIGAFLVFAWALKKGSKNARGRRALLPADAVSVLGKVPLAARQFAELLRVGNKLVLVAMTPSGPTTITEVTDPAEVDRLVGLCQQFSPHSTTKAFEHVLQQMSNEPTGGTFLGGEPLPSFSPAASAYRSHRGAARV
jgi:flagellar biogenesis protein FliO